MAKEKKIKLKKVKKPKKSKLEKAFENALSDTLAQISSLLGVSFPSSSSSTGTDKSEGANTPPPPVDLENPTL